GVNIVLYDIFASRHSYVPVACGFSRLSKCTVYPLIDEVESGASWPFPGLANLVSQDENWCVKGRFFRPESFSPVKHSLSHDAHACQLDVLFQHSIVTAGLPAVAELEVFAEELFL